MEQYIPKSAVVAEIKKLVRKNELYLDDNVSDVVRYQKAGAYSVLNDLFHFLDTLEVKEVDLEKEDVNSILERIDNEIDRLLFNNGREIDYEDVIKMIRCEIRTIRNEIKAQKGEEV